MNKKAETEKNYVKNYIVLFIICIIVVALTFYLCECFKVYKEEQNKVPVIRGVLINEITETELEPFLIENPSAVLYMCTASNEKCRSFENDFKKVINKYNLEESIVYVNLSDVEDQKAFVDNFNELHPYKKGKLTENYPAIVIAEDNKVKNILQGKKNQKLKMDKVKDFIEINKIGD